MHKNNYFRSHFDISRILGYRCEYAGSKATQQLNFCRFWALKSTNYRFFLKKKKRLSLRIPELYKVLGYSVTFQYLQDVNQGYLCLIYIIHYKYIFFNFWIFGFFSRLLRKALATSEKWAILKGHKKNPEEFRPNSKKGLGESIHHGAPSTFLA